MILCNWMISGVDCQTEPECGPRRRRQGDSEYLGRRGSVVVVIMLGDFAAQWKTSSSRPACTSGAGGGQCKVRWRVAAQ